jgi:hypothetical protein
MSWSFSVPVVPKDQFAAAVDAAQATGQPPESLGLAEDVAAAKEALKSLAGRVKRAKVGGGASGHALQPSEGNNWSDSIAANVYGSE